MNGGGFPPFLLPFGAGEQAAGLRLINNYG
jgi:hypothetical protein